MKIKIPFVHKFLNISHKAIEAAKRSLLYGSWQNRFNDLLVSGAAKVSFSTLYTIYNNLVDVKRAVRVIGNATMKEGFTLVNKEDEEKEPDKAQVEIAMRVLHNKKQTFTELRTLWVRDLGVAGNVFWLVLKNLAGDPIGLDFIDPRTASIVADEFGNIKKYIQRIVGSDTQIFDVDEVVHSVMDFDTEKPLLGSSPIAQIIWDAKSEMSASMSNFNFYENNSVPAHLLIMEEELEDDQYKEIKKAMDKNYGGAKNKFKAGMIPFLKDIKTIVPTQREMQYIETRAFNTKKIVVAFGVDSFILGYTEKVQRGNADIIYKNFYENTVREYEKLFEDVINEKLFPLLGLDKIKFVVKLSNYDNEDKVITRSREDVKTGIITINEARKARGMDASENDMADELMVNGLPLDDLGAETEKVFAAVKEQITQREKTIFNLLDG